MKIGTNAVHGMHTGPMQMKGMAARPKLARGETEGRASQLQGSRSCCIGC